jgi:hypothetical protein
VSVIDDFVFDGDQYVLRPDSELYRPRPER